MHKGDYKTYSELTNSAGENVKDLVKWDHKKYLNIWVVSNIESGAVVILFTRIGTK